MSQPQILEGTWEEIKLHDQELSGKRFRLVPIPPEPDKAAPVVRQTRQHTPKESQPVPRRLAGMGKFAGIIPSSDEFIRQKHEDLEMEERKFQK